jgi:hypothetical protein
MKHFYPLTFLLVLSVQYTIAQTVTLDWGTSIQGGWHAGDKTGTANNIGGSTADATIIIKNSQTATNPYSGFTLFTSPAVTNSYVSALGSTAKGLAAGVNWDSKTRTADITIKFNELVKNVKFNVADIDKLSATSTSYIDVVTVTGFKNNVAVTNPTFTKLVSTTTIFSIAGNKATAAPTSGQGGSANSSSTDQGGTVVVDFGTTQLDSVNIHYGNHTNADNDPGQQFILLGGVAFQPASTLPLTLTSFNGIFKNNTVQLNWTTSLEENTDKFIVEKGTNGIDWQPLTTVKATGNSIITNEYNATDAVAAAVNYYRLKMVDIDGRYTYSPTIQIRSNGAERAGIKLYPNPAANTTTLSITSDNKLAAHIKLYNQFGLQLQHLQRTLIAGSNNISVPGIGTLPTGTYIITVEDETGKKIGTIQLYKQ